MKDICFYCNYFAADTKNKVFGECRRFPPQVIVMSDKDGGWTQDYASPMVSTHDWCGEFAGDGDGEDEEEGEA